MNVQKLIPDLLASLIAVAALGAAAQLSISLPESVSVAPITGQSLAVLLIAHLLKWKWGTISIFIYLLLGSAGVPVFSDFESGTSVLLGPTMGYFIGFLLATLIVGRLAEKQKSRFPFYLLQMLIGTIIILLVGWLGLFRFLDLKTAFMKGILPFLPGALVKILIGAILLSVYRRFKVFLNPSKS